MKTFNIGNINIPVPIIQGGMGIGISLSGLASAVANMGGVGVISTAGIGLIDSNNKNKNFKNNCINALRLEIRKAREKTSGVLGVNIMSVLTNFTDMVQTSIEEGIDIIFCGAGLPLDLPKYLRNGLKTKLVPIVSSVRAASIICKKWEQNYNYLPDALVVEGPKAGGHLGFKANELDKECNSLEQLVPEIKKISVQMKEQYGKEIPVIAAGGIFSGKDIYNIIQKGASAVQLGTRFVATEECDASIHFKNAFITAVNEDIKIIKSPVGMPGRAISNKFLTDACDGKRRPLNCKYNCIKSCDYKTTLYCIFDALLSAFNGNLRDGFVFTGSNAQKIKSISTVQQVFSDLKDEYDFFKNRNKLKLSYIA